MRLSSPVLPCLAVGLLLLGARASAAQDSPDFLFGRPAGMVGIRTGLMMPRADSDIYRFVQQQLTIDRKDFNAPAFGIDLELAASRRASAVIGFDFSKTTKNSEYRDFVDNQRLPIEQTTSLREMNFSGAVKFALTPKGREVSSRAFIPAAVTPYVGAGAGVLQYDFRQYGDFIDVKDARQPIFTDTFRSDGWTPSALVFGGVDIKAWKRMYVSGEARYQWAKATLENDFKGFDPIDLAGFNATAGIHFLF